MTDNYDIPHTLWQQSRFNVPNSKIFEIKYSVVSFQEEIS